MKDIFIQQEKVDYELITTMDGNMLDTQSFNFLVGKEWNDMLYLYKLAVQHGFTPVSYEDLVEAGYNFRAPTQQ